MESLVDAFYNLAKINKIDLSQKAFMTSPDTLKYFREKCGDFNRINNPDEIASAIKNNKLPYLDPIDLEPLSPDDTVFINDRCYSKQNLKLWAESFIDNSSKPTTPETKKILTLKEIKSLDLNPMQFTLTYAKEQIELNNQFITSVRENNLKRVRDLLKKGAEIDYRLNGKTGYIIATENKYLDILEYLKAKGADTKLEIKKDELEELREWLSKLMFPQNYTIEQLKHKTELDLSHNQLKSIPALSLNLPNLRRLNLDNNKLKSIPTLSLSNLPNLKYLNLSRNRLKSIPNLNLPNLEALILSSNKLPELPNFNLPNLEALNIGFNLLTNIPNFNFPKLKYLYLEFNKLTSMPTLNFPNLQKLYLHDNPLPKTEKNRLKSIYGSKLFI